MLLVHAELCMRAGMWVDWLRTDKTQYLQALTKEIAEPNLGQACALTAMNTLPASSRRRKIRGKWRRTPPSTPPAS
jgi:hypothetical protein